jgi:hypothetical protein
MMLVTGHGHRGVLGHLNQAHLCAALPAQHWQQPAEPALKETRYSVLAGLILDSRETLQTFRENVFQSRGTTDWIEITIHCDLNITVAIGLNITVATEVGIRS